jgi:hypothetical protein
VVLPPSAEAAGTYVYWMQLFDDGCSGYIQPGWLVAHLLHWQCLVDLLGPVACFVGLSLLPPSVISDV